MEIKEFYYDEFMSKINEWQDDLDKSCQHELIISEVIDAVLDVLNDSTISEVEMTKEMFDELYVNGVVVNLKSYDDMVEFSKLADSHGYRFRSKSRYSELLVYYYGENTCYELSCGMHCDIDYFTNKEPKKIVVYKSNNR